MKKFKVFLSTLLFIFTAVLFVPECGGTARAAENLSAVMIDGVQYDLRQVGSGGYGEACLPSSEGDREEVIVHNTVEYQGIHYPVNAFRWTNGDEDDWYARGWYESLLPKNGYYQKNLKKITFEKGIAVYGYTDSYAALEEVVFANPEDCKVIQFYNCPKLKEIMVSKGYNGEINVKSCPNVTITIDPANPNFRTEDGDIYSKDGKTLYNVMAQTKEYRVKSGVTKIASYAFNGNSFIESIYLPDSVRKVDRYAFSYMKQLNTVRLSKSMKRMDNRLFYGSLQLHTLDVPKNIKKFSDNFGSDSKCGLKKVTIHASSLKKSWFGGLPKKCKVYVKNSTVKKQLVKYKCKGTILINSKL